MINEYAQYGNASLELTSDSPPSLEPVSDMSVAPSVDRSYDEGVKSVLRVLGEVELVAIARKMLDISDVSGLRCCLDEVERRLTAGAAR